ncbi:MAG: AAA family ATPase [Syntrophobacteraceae bacterium]
MFDSPHTTPTERFTSVRFRRFKGFRDYSISLRHFNIMVGPNNCGKSTIIGAFRILAEAIRKARHRNPEFIKLPDGQQLGYAVDLSNIPVATENVFYDYDESDPATVIFRISNGNELEIIFTEVGACYLICRTARNPVRTTSQFRKEFNITIGFVPILGPVEHNEQLFQLDAARLALLTHRAARNFRNIWYHYPKDFEGFRSLIQSTWPGMDIESPTIDASHTPPRLHMFCPEERIPREIFWAGFGFQVWCQMLTYIIRRGSSSIFLIDEPDIYLHSDLQRQLLGILRSLGPDIVIATHSTEIISEAEPDDLLVIDKRSRSAKRIRQPGELQQVFQTLGSNLNPVLTQLAKTRRVLFVEGKDFQVLSAFARKVGNNRISNRSNFAVVPAEGFNPNKVRDFIEGIRMTLGGQLLAAVIFDRDYRSQTEATHLEEEFERFCAVARIHKRKEIENFLLHPGAIERAIRTRLAERAKRGGTTIEFSEQVQEVLERITNPLRHRVQARYLEARKRYEKKIRPELADETITERLMAEYDQTWEDIDQRLTMVPGKEVLGMLNTYLQDGYGITITTTLVVSSFRISELPEELTNLLSDIDEFAIQRVE